MAEPRGCRRSSKPKRAPTTTPAKPKRAAAEELPLDQQRVAFWSFNPSQSPGSRSAARYERYKRARTLADFYALGGTPNDLARDARLGVIQFLDDDEAGGPPQGSEDSEDEDSSEAAAAESPLDDDDDDDEPEEEAPEEEDAAAPADDDQVEEAAEQQHTASTVFPKKKKRPSSSSSEAPPRAPPTARRSSSDKSSDVGTLHDDELAHMVHFFLCQLRWQWALVVADERGSFAAFDAELQRLGFATDDLEACEALMSKFLAGPAKGDRWVPFHTATCEQELFLFEEIRRATAWTEAEKWALCVAFSACRCVALWNEVILSPFRTREASILAPDEAFKLGGPLHVAVRAFREDGNRQLHTKAFNCYPPRGASGDRYVDFIVDRHRKFAAIGIAAYPVLKRPGVAMRDLDGLFQSFDRVGPTMSKVLLVTAHLWYPELKLLDDKCQVGDGANAAFDYLFAPAGGSAATSSSLGRLTGGAAASAVADLRQRRLRVVFDRLDDADALDALEPRLGPMIRWLAARARAKFPFIPATSLGDKITIYDLQVQLCEWRKFRKKVDPKRTAHKLTSTPSE